MGQFIALGDSSHTWLGMFANRLLELRPTASVASSMRCAVSTFHDSCKLDPRKAADNYASTRGNTRQVPAKREPASLRYEARFRDA